MKGLGGVGGKLKALANEDREVVEAICLCFGLRWPDARVISTREGKKGEELVESECPDVVILNLGLPDIDGFEILRHIRNFSNMPVIIPTVSHTEFLARVKASFAVATCLSLTMMKNL